MLWYEEVMKEGSGPTVPQHLQYGVEFLLLASRHGVCAPAPPAREVARDRGRQNYRCPGGPLCHPLPPMCLPLVSLPHQLIRW